jgi:hypothetical protein
VYSVTGKAGELAKAPHTGRFRNEALVTGQCPGGTSDHIVAGTFPEVASLTLESRYHARRAAAEMCDVVGGRGSEFQQRSCVSRIIPNRADRLGQPLLQGPSGASDPIHEASRASKPRGPISTFNWATGRRYRRPLAT